MGFHLAIDAVGAKHGGAAVVLREVLLAAFAERLIERVTVFASPLARHRDPLPDCPRLSVVERDLVDRSPLARVLWLSSGLSVQVERAGANALLCLSGGGFPPPGVNGATLIQQSLPFSVEGLAMCTGSTRLRMRVIQATMKQSCHRSQRVVVQTNTMKRWICEAFQLAASKVIVARPGPPVLPVDVLPASSLNLMRAVPRRLRLLYVGSTAGYKNVERLATAFMTVRKAVPGAALFLTIPADHPLCQRAGVIGLGALPRATLRQAYELASFLVMPSIVETVGLPMLEAMSIGTPVLAADRPYAREICGDVATYFDPLDPGDIARKIIDRLSDDRTPPACRSSAPPPMANIPPQPYRIMLCAALGTIDGTSCSTN